MIKMKCFDGTEIIMNKFNNLGYGGLTNYDSLISELDIIGQYKINDITRYGISSPPSNFERATGIDARSFFEHYTKESPFKIQITANYYLELYATKGESSNGYVYGISLFLKWNKSDRELTFFSTPCQETLGIAIEVPTYLMNTMTNLTFSELPRLIISVDNDDIKKVSKMQFGILKQDFDNYGNWGNIYYIVSGVDMNSTSVNEDFIKELRQNEAISEPVTPNVPDVYGNFDNSSDNIVLPAIEDINIMSSIASDLVKAYQIDLANLNQLTSFLWSDGFIDTIKKLQNNPMENIQKLFYLPYDVEVSASETVKIGNADSNIQGNRIIKQFQEIDFGSIDITEYYGNTLDYNTELSIYLPFIGEKTLNIYDIMGGSLNLKYRVDILTGNCIAILSIVRKQNDVTLNSVLYTYIGDMSNSVPLTSTQNNFFKQILGNLTNPTALITNSGVQFTMAGVSGVNATTYTHSGNIGGNNGFMSVLTPYLIIRRPVNVKPADYEKTFGYPAYTSVTLENQKGYCRYKECYFDTKHFDTEKDVADEILTKLKTKGIYIK